MYLTLFQWVFAFIAAFIVGIGKSGIPGAAMLAIAIFAMIFEPAESLGLMLPILICSNTVAVFLYRKIIHWPLILKLIPFTTLGILAGSLLINWIDVAFLRPLIGAILIALCAIHFYRQWLEKRDYFSNQISAFSSTWMLAFVGFTGGFVTITANAAGPVTILYLLTLRLSKYDLVGTLAWYYFIVNFLKIPFQVQMSMLSLETLKISLILGPVAILATILGPKLLSYIPQKFFNLLVWVFVIITALYLII